MISGAIQFIVPPLFARLDPSMLNEEFSRWESPKSVRSAWLFSETSTLAYNRISSNKVVFKNKKDLPLSDLRGLLPRTGYASSVTLVQYLRSRCPINKNPMESLNIIPMGVDQRIGSVHDHVHFPFPSIEIQLILSGQILW